MTTVYPTDNEWGIPTLRLDQQARVVLPVLPWGSRHRRSVMTGTWVFYVDDYRFGALEKQPDQLMATGCAGAVELNPSVFDQTPRALVLAATYRKREAARRWQDAGIPVLVDLNVPERHLELSLLGVPRGWRAFATRGYAARPEALTREYEAAREVAGGEPSLLVYGGGSSIEALTRTLPGALYVEAHWTAERRSVASGRAKLQPANATADESRT
jgi:hypothetical protein